MLSEIRSFKFSTPHPPPPPPPVKKGVWGEKKIKAFFGLPITFGALFNLWHPLLLPVPVDRKTVAQLLHGSTLWVGSWVGSLAISTGTVIGPHSCDQALNQSEAKHYEWGTHRHFGPVQLADRIKYRVLWAVPPARTGVSGVTMSIVRSCDSETNRSGTPVVAPLIWTMSKVNMSGAPVDFRVCTNGLANLSELRCTIIHWLRVSSRSPGT